MPAKGNHHNDIQVNYHSEGDDHHMQTHNHHGKASYNHCEASDDQHCASYHVNRKPNHNHSEGYNNDCAACNHHLLLDNDPEIDDILLKHFAEDNHNNAGLDDNKSTTYHSVINDYIEFTD